MAYTKIEVSYTLDDAEISRLQALKDALNKEGGHFLDEASVFSAIMLAGSKWDINDKLAFAEFQAGLKTHEEYQTAKNAWKKKEGATV